MNYFDELKEFAIFANTKAMKGQKYSYKRKLVSISNKYNKSFEEVFNDWQQVRMGF